jgi:hypothetical protein
MRMPAGVTLEDGVLCVRRRTRESPVLLGLIAGFVALLAHAAANPWTAKLEFPPYRVAMTLVAAGLGYFLLRVLVNVTRFTIANGALHVSHGPLPPRHAFSIQVSSIVGVGYAPLRGVYASLHGGETRQLCYEEASPELPALLVEGLGLPAAIRPAGGTDPP